MKLPTLKEYDIMCSKHDWYYFHSDDFKVWQKGDTESKLLATIARDGGEEYHSIYMEHIERTAA